ncbi:OsmC family protein [Flindersiella endophytica]
MNTETHRTDPHENAVYTTLATSSGRDRRAVSDDGLLDVPLALPKALGGNGDGTNPEQLFAAGYAACFATSMRYVARQMRLDADDVAVTARVSLVEKNPGSGYNLAVSLTVDLPEHLRGDTGAKLLEATHGVCPYSKATQGNIPVVIGLA